MNTGHNQHCTINEIINEYWPFTIIKAAQYIGTAQYIKKKNRKNKNVKNLVWTGSSYDAAKK